MSTLTLSILCNIIVLPSGIQRHTGNVAYGISKIYLKETKMLKLHTQSVAAPSYAQIKNSRFNNSASNIVSLKSRWNDTYNSLPYSTQQTIDYALQSAIAEFNRRNPNLKSWSDLLDLLPESKYIQMRWTFIDSTMQRLLKQFWCIEIKHNFNPIKAVPIQVYRPDPNKDEYVAWDGQHTLVTLWLIATQIFGLDPEEDDILIPVNVYKTSQKAEMRDSFVGHNGGDYKEPLDQFDTIEQMIYGVRVDNSQNPLWIEVGLKQSVLEKYDLFLTKKDVGDHNQPGAISRTQEFMKLNPTALEWLCQYLVAAGCNSRPAEEKEIVMMSYFFERCRSEKIKVDRQFITDIAMIAKKYWNCDLSPFSPFWTRAQIAYQFWHQTHVSGVQPRFNKEPLHGYPFLVSQLVKDLPQHQFPTLNTSSNFIPDQGDLFI